MGICRSSTYWYWPMSTPDPKKNCTTKIFGKEEELQFIEEGNLKKTCSACVCMTWQHLHYFREKHCRTLLSCHVYRRLIHHGHHLISGCHLRRLLRERDRLVVRGILTPWLDKFVYEAPNIIFDECIGFINIMSFIDEYGIGICSWLFFSPPQMDL